MAYYYYYYYYYGLGLSRCLGPGECLHSLLYQLNLPKTDSPLLTFTATLFSPLQTGATWMMDVYAKLIMFQDIPKPIQPDLT